VNIPSDITSQSYNTQKGEELANAALSLSQNGNDNESLPPNLIQGGLLSSQLMVSSQVPQKTHYTVGVLRDGTYFSFQKTKQNKKSHLEIDILYLKKKKKKKINFILPL